MKRKQVEELQTKTKAELLKLLEELKKEVQNAKIDIAMHKTMNTAQIKEKGKDIARVQTLLATKGEE
jgi:ribosomal protein L29